MEEEIEEPWYKGPIKYILVVFLVLLLVLWLIPSYSIRLDPNPSSIPSLEDVLPSEIDVSENVSNQITLKMINGRDPVVKSVADKIVVKACPDGGRICQAKTIYYFVQQNFNYVSDPTAYEYVKTAKQSLVSGGAMDCDDGAVLAISLMDAIGIKSRFVFIPRHVYIEIWLPEALNRYKSESEWVALDLTCKHCEFGEIPYQSNYKTKTYLPSY